MFRIKHFAVFVVLWVCIFGVGVAYAAKNEAERLWELGEKAYGENRYDEALNYYKKSLAICGSDLECTASNLNGIGAVYEAKDDDKKAFPYYEQALAAARKANNRDLIATNLFNTGAVYYRAFNQSEKALGLHEESLSLFRQLDDKKSAALVLFSMGKILNSLGRYDRALSVLNESLGMNRAEKNEPAVAAALNVIGNVYGSLGQYDKPLAYYQEALQINRRLNIPNEIATSLRNIGDAYCDLVERDRALAYYQEALEIQKKNNFRFDLAITQTNIGALYKDLDQYDRALFHYEEALKIAKELENTAMIAVNANNMGNVYANIGKSDMALSYYGQSLKLETELGRPQKLAIVMNNMGMEYFRLGQYDKALQYLGEALKIERKLNNPHQIAARLNNIGAVYLRQRRYAEAERVLLERKNIGRQITKTRLIHAGLVEVYLATKRYDEALALLKELPPNWRDSRTRRMEYQTQYGLALQGKGERKQSARELLKAVAIVEEIRRSVSDRDVFFGGGGYISRLTPYSELMAELSAMSLAGEAQEEGFRTYGRDAAASAFYFAELAKARTLLESMAGAAKTYEDAQIPPDVRNREAGILRELSAIEGMREGAYAKGEAAVKQLLQREEGLIEAQRSLVHEIRKKFPLYAAINYPRPIPSEALPLKDNEVLIAFGLSDRALMVFTVRKGGIQKIRSIPVSAEGLADRIKKFVEPLSSGRYEAYSTAEAAALYKLLLSDAVADIKETEKLIIVPDGILGLLPFEALIVKEGKDFGDSLYAGDKWTITYAQSATSLALTRLREMPAAGKSLFALGNPIYDKADPRYIAYKQGKPAPALAGDAKQYAFRGLTVQPKADMAGDKIAWEELVYPPLPETEEEVRAIAKLFGLAPDPPDILLGIAATETNLRKVDLKGYRYLHFATHADLPGKVQGIKEPFIILGQVENQGGDDGFLTLSEVLGLKLNADLVVLSACSTGRGKLMAGEGVANFARAFQHAGARGTVVSLWEVASEAAVTYMKSFYGKMRAGMGKAEALRLARKEVKEKYPHPFFWSVFVLYGEG